MNKNDIKEAKDLKKRIEADILQYVSGLIVEFKHETNLRVGSVNINIEELKRVGFEDESFVSNVHVNVTID